MATEEITPTLEKQILVRAATDPEFRAKAKRRLNGVAFSDRVLSWVWQLVKDAPNNELVSIEFLEAKAQVAFHSDEDRLEQHLLVIAEIFRLEHSSAELSLDAVEQLGSFSKLETGLVQAARELERGELDTAWHTIQLLKRADNSSGAHIRYIETWEDRQTQRRDAAKSTSICVPTRIKTIDKIIDGLRLGELGVLSGTTGRGKSIISCNFALTAAIFGFPTAIFTTEMLADQVTTRLDSRMLRVEYRRFKRFEFSEADERKMELIISRRRRQLKQKLHVFDAPIGRCNVEFVEEKIADLESEGIQIVLAVIDSPDHFRSDRRYDQKRHEHAEVFWRLKGMARGEGMVPRRMGVWATTQAPQEFEHKVAGTRAVSETYDKARIADVMMTLNQDSDQEKSGEMIINLAKYRDGRSRVQVKVQTHFETMSFEELGEVDEAEAVDKSTLVKDLPEDV